MYSVPISTVYQKIPQTMNNMQSNIITKHPLSQASIYHEMVALKNDIKIVPGRHTYMCVRI
jgi:hypothetical protein